MTRATKSVAVRRVAAGAVSCLLLLAGCSAGDDGSAPHPDAPTVTSTADLLAAHDLEGMSGEEIVDTLEADTRERPLPLEASVRSDEVIVSQDGYETSVPLQSGLFYVSFAPYRDQTHECRYHALGSCQGELVGETFRVEVSDQAGNPVIEDQRTTGTNGFIGLWLPKDDRFMLTVTAEDQMSAQVEIGTSADDPTCVTTVQLS